MKEFARYLSDKLDRLTLDLGDHGYFRNEKVEGLFKSTFQCANFNMFVETEQLAFRWIARTFDITSRSGLNELNDLYKFIEGISFYADSAVKMSFIVSTFANTYDSVDFDGDHVELTNKHEDKIFVTLFKTSNTEKFIDAIKLCIVEKVLDQ